MEKWTDNINGEPYTSRGVRTVRRRVLGNTTIVIWKGAGYLAYIVANRINYNGKNTADHFNNYARVGKFCRKMELELGLRITPEMHLTAENKQQPRQTADQALLTLKQAIDSILPNVSSMQELGTALQKQGVKTLVKRGVTFINTQNGMKVKGSDIGRQYSLANLEERLGVAQVPQKSKSEDLSQAKQRRKGLSI